MAINALDIKLTAKLENTKMAVFMQLKPSSVV
jgi:hypothetical protein